MTTERKSLEEIFVAIHGLDKENLIVSLKDKAYLLDKAAAIADTDLERLERRLQALPSIVEAYASKAEEVYGLGKGREYRTKAIEILEKGGYPREAAKIAEKTGLIEKAIENYETAGEFHDAALLATKAGFVERAISNYERAAIIAKTVTDQICYRRDAAEIAEKNGFPAVAQKFYRIIVEKLEELCEDAVKANKAGLPTIPGDLYRDAADFAEKAGLLEKAKELRQKAEQEIK